MSRSQQETKKIDVGACKTINIAEIKSSKFNAREQKEAVDSDDFVELCDSIKENGLIEPIIVRKTTDNGHYEAIAGTRRLRAMKHVGVKEAPVVVRKMDDNDVRIVSLVENIHRKGLEFEEKKKTLVDIYKSEGFRDLVEVTKYLSRIHSRKWNKTSQREDITRRPQIPIPDGFEELASRIGYSPSRQYNILKGYSDEKPAAYRNYLADMTEQRREIIESEPELKKHPIIQQEVAKQTKRIAPKKIARVVQQYVHDIKTGAIKEDDGDISFYPSKRENISKRPETEMNPVRAREAIMDLSEKLFKLITGMDQDGDVYRAEKQVESKQALDNITQICTYSLAAREKRALQDTILPLEKAIEKLVDKIEETE